MKRLFFIFPAFIFVLCAQAQNKKIDSLNNLIAKATSDTARINLLNEKASDYTQNSLDSSISITKATIEKSKQVHYTKGEADGYRIAGLTLTLKGAFKPALDNYKTAEQLYIETGDSGGLNRINRGYGIFYGMQSKYDSSIIFFRKVVDYYEKTGSKKDLVSAYQNMAVSYTMLSNFVQSIAYQNKALHLAELTKDTTNLAYINLNMAIGYTNVHDYARSEALLHKAILYARQAQLKNVELYGYTNMATVCLQLNRFPEAYDYAMKASTLGKQLGDYAIVASSMARASEALAHQQQYSKAEQLSAQAIAIADTTGSPMNLFQTLQSMGYIKALQKQYPLSITYYEKAMAALKDADIYDDQIADAYGEMANAYEQTGMYQKALASFKAATKIGDSIRSRENIRRATEQSMNYDFAKKEQATQAEQDKKNTIANARQLALMIGLGCTLLLIVGAVIAYRNKQKANGLLLHQKNKLEDTLVELKTTQTQLIHSEKMASLGELTAGIAHEIQNPLNFVNNFSEINNELLDEMEEEIDVGNTQQAKSLAEEIKQNMDKIVHHGKRADSIVKSMLLHSRKNTGQKEPTDINALADEYLRLSYHGLRAKDKTFNATIQSSFDPSVDKINVIRQDIGRVILNLFNNAFYEVNKKLKNVQSLNTEVTYHPTVTVVTKRTPAGGVEICVRDNGNGIAAENINKIFQPFFTTKPTGEGTGLGLSLSYDIITQGHGGSLTVHSQEGEYSEFIIILPA